MNAAANSVDLDAITRDTPAEKLVAHLALAVRTRREVADAIGPGTRTFPLLVAAFADVVGDTPASVEPVLAQCRDTAEPRAVALYRRVEELERELVEARARATALETEALVAAYREGSR